MQRGLLRRMAPNNINQSVDLETVLLRGEHKRCDLLGELVVVIEPAALLFGQLAADLVVLGMLDDRLGDVLVAEVDRRQQRLIDLSPVHVIQQVPHRLQYYNAILVQLFFDV